MPELFVEPINLRVDSIARLLQGFTASWLAPLKVVGPDTHIAATVSGVVNLRAHTCLRVAVSIIKLTATIQMTRAMMVISNQPPER
jgi:hypothetical protein